METFKTENRVLLSIKLFAIYHIIYGLLELPYIDIIYNPYLDFQAGALESFGLGYVSLFVHVFLILISVCLVFVYTPYLLSFFLLFKMATNFLSVHQPPEVRFVNFYLLTSLIYLIAQKNVTDKEKINKTYYNSLWLVTGAAYFYSFLDKLQNPEWQQGLFLSVLFKYGHVDRAYLDNITETIDLPLIRLCTYLALLFEGGFIFFIFFKTTRLFALCSLTLMHFTLICTTSLEQISIAMVIFHLALFDDYSMIKIKVLFNLTLKKFRYIFRKIKYFCIL